MAYYHEKVEPLSVLDVVGAAVIALTKSNRIVMTAPLDCIHTSAHMSKMMNALRSMEMYRKAEHRDLYITGIITPAARAALRAHGLRLHEKWHPIETMLREGGKK